MSRLHRPIHAACCAPWTLPLSVAALMWSSRRRSIVALPAAVVVAPTYLSILVHPSAWVALTSTTGGVHAYTRASSWFAFLGMPAAPQSTLDLIASGVLGGGVALLALLAVARHRTTALVTALSAALVAALCGWAASHVGVGLDGALVASAWTSPAFSVSFGLLLLAASQLIAPMKDEDGASRGMPRFLFSGGEAQPFLP